MTIAEAVGAFEARFRHVADVEPLWSPPVGESDRMVAITAKIERAPDALAPTQEQEAALTRMWARLADRRAAQHGGDVLLWRERPRLEVLPAVRDAPALFAIYARVMFTASGAMEGNQ